MATTQFGASTFEPLQVALQADGKVVALGDLNNGGFGLVRYTFNGSPDPTFGIGGLVVLPWSSLPSAQSVTPGSVAVQSDGRVLVSGSVLTSPNPDYPAGAVIVSRFNSNGSLDTTFNGSGTTTIASPAFFVNVGNPNSIAVQPNGKILVTAESSPGVFALMRLDPNGALDTLFASGGVATVQVSQGASSPTSAGGEAVAVAFQANGSILLAGDADTQGNGTTEEFALVRLTQMGALDTSFGADGVVVTAFSNTTPPFAIGQAMALQPDGNAVVVGGGGETPAYLQPPGVAIAMARYQTANFTGATATSFTTLAAPATAPFDSPVTLTATVSTPSRKPPPSGTVTFLSGTTVLGAAELGVGSAPGTASISVPLPGGNDLITVVYSGDGSSKPSSSGDFLC